ncbi:MAG: diaminopropionate ammonia-lyase [Flavobacteriaceae bacterium]|nr:diaminopropionate ammonia-lyase [Flavobacteriaceae bacterium]|tara:strand:- start:1347 stop:2459 length:1113 start_codon:yes stop_codon:yes gene_type:complete
MKDFILNYPSNILKKDITYQILNDSKSISFHRTFKNYKKSPLYKLSALSNFLKISKLYVKDESNRFGLDSFKVLGGSYAVNQILKNKPKVSIFCTATDGNHGKGLAWSAKKYKKKCIVYVPKNTSKQRIKSISELGASVEQLEMNYEDTCKYAAKISFKMNWELVQDASWDNYELIPAYIMSGYLTHFIEMEENINKIKQPDLDIVIIQCGVGSWAASCIWYYLSRYGKNKPKIVLVEPEESCGVYQSLNENKRISPKGNLSTIMAGLNCGIPSKSAWEIIKRGCDGVIKITDAEVMSAMNLFYKPLSDDSKIISGESGAAGLAGLIKCIKDKKLKKIKDHIGLNKDSRVLIFNSEGKTDINSFSKIVEK